ncbi:MAG: porin, partial [Parvibaculaceae bacterium]
GIGLPAGNILGNEMTWWGVGINQTIDAAAMDVYLQYKHFEGSILGGIVDVSDLDMVALGAIIRF